MRRVKHMSSDVRDKPLKLLVIGGWGEVEIGHADVSSALLRIGEPATQRKFCPTVRL